MSRTTLKCQAIKVYIRQKMVRKRCDEDATEKIVISPFVRGTEVPPFI